jgi:5-formyltetrahydrofolate cyclo-ligase
MEPPLSEPADVLAQKKALRASAKTVRTEAFLAHGAAAAAAIARYGIAFADPPPGAVVSAFSAIGEELDPMPLMLRLVDQGYRLCLPVMQGKGKPLIFRRWHPGDELAETTWGIREPLPSAPELVPEIVLAALLAFDARGYRLGYGGGFYDRTLAAVRAHNPVVAIGLAYDEQRVDAVPHLDYDQQLDWVLTPSGPLRCRGS